MSRFVFFFFYFDNIYENVIFVNVTDWQHRQPMLIMPNEAAQVITSCHQEVRVSWKYCRPHVGTLSAADSNWIDPCRFIAIV